MTLLRILLLALLPGFTWAVCPPHGFADPDHMRLTGDAVMIVTHATSTHDARFATKRGVDEAVRYARRMGMPVIYLQDDSPPQYYFMEDCEPDYWVFSQGGEITFEIPPSNVYVVGGHLELCLAKTLNDVLETWAVQSPRNLTLTFFMDGIYSNGKAVEEGDHYYPDFQKFMSVVTHGRPGGEHWPKLSLLETMGVIVKEEHELEYLKKILPPYERTMPEEYRVELTLNDSVVKVLQPAEGWHPPTLRFRFFDSAANLEPLQKLH